MPLDPSAEMMMQMLTDVGLAFGADDARPRARAPR